MTKLALRDVEEIDRKVIVAKAAGMNFEITPELAERLVQSAKEYQVLCEAKRFEIALDKIERERREQRDVSLHWGLWRALAIAFVVNAVLVIAGVLP